MKIDRKEVLRYMRMGGQSPDEVLEARLNEVEKAVAAASRPAAYWRLEQIEWDGDAVRSVGAVQCESRNLSRTLAGCSHAFLFCATIGAGVDTLLRRYSQTSAADTLMAQAVGTALIESWCDECEERMLEEVRSSGERLRMRYSPGYGDLSLAVQKELLVALDSQRKAGIVLTPELLMIPSKSVSAIVGAAKE